MTDPKMVVTVEKLKEWRACWLTPDSKPKLQPACDRGCCGGPERLAERLAKWKEREKERRALVRKTKKFLGTEGRPLSEVVLFWPQNLHRGDLCWLIGSVVGEELGPLVYPACWLGDPAMPASQAEARQAFINIVKLEHGLPVG